LKNQNSTAFNDNSAEFTDNSTTFTNNSVIFEKPFWLIKKIWVNLNFNKLNDIVFEKISSPIYSKFILVFNIFFIFSNISNQWTVKSSILKFGGDRIHRISVKLAEFVNPAPQENCKDRKKNCSIVPSSKRVGETKTHLPAQRLH
jgi:hypothetical protein